MKENFKRIRAARITKKSFSMQSSQPLSNLVAYKNEQLQKRGSCI